MLMEQILSEVRNYDGILELAPMPESDYAEVSWGDRFFYYAPDGQVPRNRQPFATIVTKNYPEDVASRLDEAGRWRLNIQVGSSVFTELLGYAPQEATTTNADYSAEDVVNPHPLYGAYGWVCIVNPGPLTRDRALEALRVAHMHDRRRVERRQSRDSRISKK